MVTKLEEIHKKIEELQREAEAIATKEKASVIDDIRNKIRLYNISLRDLGFSSSTPTHRSPAPIKYRLDNNAWSGKGRQPRWMVEYLAQGGKIEDLQVK